jgi:FtsP/CotA-like multicopper oxidase with cupredoxin domain
MDGTDLVGGLVIPGESFEYRFELKDAATFWYHPHWNTDEQIERGLYGQLLVRDDPIEAALDGVRERVWMLDDVDLDAQGQLLVEPSAEDRLLGRRGDTLLVNGRPAPTIDVRGGSLEHWRVTNASNGRYFRLALAGHRFEVIASDGGLVADPYLTEELLLAPADRLEVLVRLEAAAGTELPLHALPHDRGIGSDERERTLLTLRFGRERPTTPPAIELPRPVIEPLFAEQAERERQLELRLDLEPQGAEPIAYTINGDRFPFTDPLEASVGDVEIWSVVNRTPVALPFHLHGFFFQVLDDAAGDTLEDVVDVRPGATLRIGARFDRPGAWLFHSHIPEHGEAGMMGWLNVR